MQNNKNGVQIDDFMFSDEAELEKYKVGLESVEVPAGKFFALIIKKFEMNRLSILDFR